MLIGCCSALLESGQSDQRQCRHGRQRWEAAGLRGVLVGRLLPGRQKPLTLSESEPGRWFPGGANLRNKTLHPVGRDSAKKHAVNCRIGGGCPCPALPRRIALALHLLGRVLFSVSSFFPVGRLQMRGRRGRDDACRRGKPCERGHPCEAGRDAAARTG